MKPLIKVLFLGLVVMPSLLSAQTTYYSFATGDWEDNTSWTLTSDGSSGAVGGGIFPGRADNVVIRSGHTITIDDTGDNGSVGQTADALGFGTFPGSGSAAFYQTGDVIVSNGGTFTSSVRTMLAGLITVEGGGTFSVTGTANDRDLFLLGSLTVETTATFDIGNDFVLAGNSFAIINNSSVSGDDIFIASANALLCGDGTATLGSSIDYFNSGTSDQICSSFSVVCPDCGGGDLPSGVFLTGNTGPGGIGDATNNELWLRASDINQADATAVTSWSDASGNGLTANSSGVGSEEPTFQANSVNGFPSVNFDGDDFLNLGNPASLNFTPGTDSWSFLAVYNVAGALQGTLLSKATQADRHYQYTIDEVSGISYFTAFIGGDATIGSIVATDDWFVSSCINDDSQKDSWTNEGPNFAGETIGGDINAAAEVLIGARRASGPTTGTGFQLTGDIAEIMMWDGELNDAQRIIATNYLAAKYNIALADNDLYLMDETSNGDFDFEIAGIGQAADGSNHFDAKGSGVVRMWNPSDLDNNEFLIWGHDNTALSTTQTTDVDGTIIEERLSRIWRVSETGDVGTVSISFDFSSLADPLGSNLRLLIDRNGDGFFDNDVIPIAGSESNDIVTFSNVDFQDGDRFTLGNTNLSIPLPVELLSFTAAPTVSAVQLNWQTATETNNDFFTVERSKNLDHWFEVSRVDGMGNHSLLSSYGTQDRNPLQGTSYYRLKQTDFDGTSSYSSIVSVEWFGVEPTITVWPNPSAGIFKARKEGLASSDILIYNNTGKKIDVKVEIDPSILTINLSDQPNGVYLMRIGNASNQNIKLIKN